MKYSSPPSLIRAASVTIVSSLWNRHEIIADIKNHLLESENCKTWSVTQSVDLLVEKTTLPPAIKLDLKNLVKLMGVEVYKWISLTKPLFQYTSYSPQSISFVWSNRGIFDCDKTTDLIIESCSDKVLCFCLACIFSLEQKIYKLWPSVRQCGTDIFNNNSSVCLSVAINFWVGYLNNNIKATFVFLEGEGFSYFPIQMQNCEYALLKLSKMDPRCLSTLNYFFMQIEPENTKAVVLQALQFALETSRPRDRNLVVFLLNKLSKQDIIPVVRCNCYGVLTSFLIWPYTDFFMLLMDSTWDCLSEVDYLKLLEDIFEFSSELSGDNVYKHIFKQVWLSTPLHFKQYIIKKCITGSLLSRLFVYENTDDLIQLIFNDCSAEQKQQMIFYFEGMNLCDLLVKKKRWCSLKLLVKNCISSKNILEKFIREYENYRPYYYNEDTRLRTIALHKKIQEWYVTEE